MKSKWMFVTGGVGLFLLLSLGTKAQSAEALLDYTSEQIGYGSFLETIPSGCMEWLTSVGVDFTEGSSFPGLLEIFSLCYALFLSVLGEHLPLLSVGLLLLLLFKTVSVFCDGSSRLTESLAFLAVVSSGIYSFSVLDTLLSMLIQVTEQASAFLTSALPVAMSARVWSGSPDGATVMSLTLPPVLAVMSSLVSALFHPLCLFCYAASLCGFFRGEIGIRPFVSSVRRFCVRGVEIVSGLAVGVFCVQKAVVSSGDTVIRRGIRFALTQMLPMAGGALTDGMETVYACGKSLSGKVGVICVLVLFFMFATPCIFGFLLMLLYSLLSSVGNMLSVPLLADFFGDMKDTVAVATSFAVCSLTVLASALLLMTGGI